MTAPIDYDRLTADFNLSLVTTLRGHKPTEDYLEIWVPDEDPVKGILNMVEAAQAAGRGGIELEVSTLTLPVARHAELHDELAGIGEVAIQAINGKTLVSVSQLNQVDHFASVASGIRDGLRQASGRLQHAGALPTDGTLVRYEAAEDGLALAVMVDPSRNIIVHARHAGGDLVQQAVLDTLCRAIEGTTVQEAADHGAIKALYAVVDRSQKRPVAGILLPRNANFAFAAAERLVRRLHATYRAASGEELRPNEFMTLPSGTWQSKSSDEKRSTLAAAVFGFATDRGLPPDSLHLERIERDLLAQDIRIVITIGDQVPGGDKPALCRALERHLKDGVEATLQLYVEEVKDRNAIRRL